MAFPTTSLLDNFNRGDSGTLGASWSTPIEPTLGSLGILSNQAYSDAQFDDAYWGTSFGENQEVYVTLSVVTSGVTAPRVYARIQNPNTASRNCYFLTQEGAGGGWISKIVAGTTTALGGGWTTSIASGDKVGLELNGTTITAWKYSGGSWSQLEQLTGESSVTGGGYIGLQIRGETDTRFDDFSGGDIVTGTSGGQRLLTLGVG